MHESIYTHTQDYVRHNNEYILKIESLKNHPELATDVFLADLDSREEALSREQYKVPSFDDIVHHIERIKSVLERLKYSQELYSEIGLFADKNLPSKFNPEEDNADIADIYNYHDGLSLLKNRIGQEIVYLLEEQVEPVQDIVESKEVIQSSKVEVQPSPIPTITVDDLSKRKRLNTSEAAYYMGISVKRLQNLISDGTIPKDAYRGTRRSRIFLRSKLDLYRECKLVDTTQYLKVNWLKNKYFLEAFMAWISGKFTDMNLEELKQHFTRVTSEIQSIPNGINWKMPTRETNHKSLVMLASMLVLLHKSSYIDLGTHGSSFKLRPFMTTHFTLNGKRIADKTASDAIAEIRSDEDDGYYPIERPFESLFTEYLTQNEILRRVKADSAKED